MAEHADPWLDRWLPLLRERNDGSPVLELGCGGGLDTEILSANGMRVVALDALLPSVEAAIARVPAASIHCQDMRDPWPLGPGTCKMVIASLSLHYFSWEETVALVQRVHDVLMPGGVLLCRLNSTDDHNYGASGHPAIADNYYLVDGVPKRFFDRGSVVKLFAGSWKFIGLEEMTIGRYRKPKRVWEVVLERLRKARR